MILLLIGLHACTAGGPVAPASAQAEAVLQMPPLPRLVLLGMLLPEPEPILRGKEPGLFPPP